MLQEAADRTAEAIQRLAGAVEKVAETLAPPPQETGPSVAEQAGRQFGEFFTELKSVFAGGQNTTNELLIAAGFTLGAWFLVLLIRRIVAGRLEALGKKTKNRTDDLMAALLWRTSWFLVLVFALLAGAQVLEMAPVVKDTLVKVIVLALLVQIGIWGNGTISFFLVVPEEATEKQEATARMLQSMGFLCRMAIWGFILLLALANLGVDVTALIAGASVGGLAIAIALKGVLEDLFASISIILDKPFKVGDFIIVGSEMGTVERIGLKTSRVRSLTGEQIVFSNADLLGSRIRNFKVMEERRIVFGFGVTYQTPLEKIRAIPDMVKEIIEEQTLSRFDRAHFKSFGASSLDFEAVFHMKVPDYAVYMDVQQAINLALFERLEGEGVEFAYPTQTIFLEGPAPAAA